VIHPTGDLPPVTRIRKIHLASGGVVTRALNSPLSGSLLLGGQVVLCEILASHGLSRFPRK
jgi:hypothetical protein